MSTNPEISMALILFFSMSFLGLLAIRLFEGRKDK